MTLRWSPGYAAVDADFDSVSLLLHGDGTNGSTTILDSSPTPKTVTAFGDAQISTAQSKFGGASIAFDGSGDGLTVPDSVDFDFGSTDFTVEIWAYFNSLSGTKVVATQGWSAGLFSPWLILQNSNNIEFFASSNGTTWGIASNLLIKAASINTWYHIAVCRSANTIRTFCDGINTASVVSSLALMGSSGNIGIGADANGTGNSINGYIDDLRITKGVARYTSNFTPPTAPFPDLSPTTRLTLP